MDRPCPWMKFNMATILHYSIQRAALENLKRLNDIWHRCLFFLEAGCERKGNVPANVEHAFP
jgi:hypothetical protein